MLLRSLTKALLFVLILGVGEPGHALAQQADSDPDLSLQALLADPQTPIGGNPNGDLTIVEFFDYNCPYCAKAEPALEKLVASDPGIRLVYKEWPIFGAGSKLSAKLALAAMWQGKYETVHRAFFAAPGRKSDADRIRAIAKRAAVDMTKLDSDLAVHGGEIDAVLARTEKQANKLGAPGTPVFLIGPLIVESAPDFEEFQKLAARARAKQKGGD